MNNVFSPLIATKARLTPARKSIYLVFTKSTFPLTAGEVMSKVKANKTTIYREIDFLLKKDLICEVVFGDGQLRYESTLLDHHHHLVCLGCKKISDTKLVSELSGIEKNIENNVKFKVIRHNLEFFGYCSKCQ